MDCENGMERRDAEAQSFIFIKHRGTETQSLFFERTEFSKLSLRVFVSLCPIFSQTNLLLKKQK